MRGNYAMITRSLKDLHGQRHAPYERKDEMNRTIKFAFAALAVAAATPVTTSAGEAPRRSKALVLMWDGMRADAVINAGCTNLLKLVGGTWQPGYNGAWSFCGKPIPDARGYSFANHASILNGVFSAKHGVRFNHEARRCKVKEWPSWLSRLIDAKPSFRAAYIFDGGGNDQCLCADDRVMMKNFGLDGIGEGNYAAELCAAADGPDAIVVYFENPDAFGHRNGYYPTSPEYINAVRENDLLLGKMMDAIAARPTFKDEDWLIGLTADHGGYGKMHGWRDTHTATIPVIVASRHVVNGQMAGFPGNYDLPVTALAHFGVDTSKMNLDGKVVGGQAASWKAAARLDEALTWHYPVNVYSKYLDNAVRGGPGSVNIGDETYFNPNAQDGPFKNRFCLWIGGDEDVQTAAWLKDSTDMFLCPHPSFTISFWAKMPQNPAGDPVILGNKDYARAGSPGFVVTTGRHTERARKGACIVYGTPQGVDEIVGTFDVEGKDKWTFYAVVFTAEGHAWFFQGRTNGMFNWICAKAGNALLGSGLPLHIGQDGTGTFKWNFSGRLDDIAIWKRSLTVDEVRSIYTAGREGRDIKDMLSGSGPKAKQ